MDDAEPWWIALSSVLPLDAGLDTAVGKQRELDENLVQIKAWKAREISDRWTFRSYFNWFFEVFWWVWRATWVSLPLSSLPADWSCTCYLQVRLGCAPHCGFEGAEHSLLFLFFLQLNVIFRKVSWFGSWGRAFFCCCFFWCSFFLLLLYQLKLKASSSFVGGKFS